MLRFSMMLLAAAALSACANGSRISSNVPRGAAAYQVIPASASEHARQQYRIGPLDSINVTVFQEPELSTEATTVDATGKITLPLIGSIDAAGKTASELSSEIAQRLGEKYLVDPQVSVLVAGSASQKVSVQGEVTEPGVYEIKGPTTLLEALAMAKGETRVAALREVVVFRTVDGQRLGGVFDVASIRRGEAADPQLRGNDVIVVGHSTAKSIWRDIVTAAPLFNVFRPLGY
ncbi:MAG TPA: polysaccharide biosynthesis/export family protein [Sphingomicrobium sp.]|nr:polysaccharide biosynthesis/export family protein [Sphingomicrobium sp.]